MEILAISALPPERPSFVGRILPLMRALHRAGHQVEVLTLSGAIRPPFTETIADVHGVAIRVVGPNIRPTTVTTPTLGRTWQRLHTGHRALASTLAERRADIVVLAKPQFQNTGPALAFAARTRTPLVLDVDDLEGVASRLPAPLRWYARALEARAARAAAVITAGSPFLVAYYQRLNPGTRVELLPTGIAIPPSVPPAHLRERLGLPPDATIILYLGSLSLSSGHRVDTLIDAFSRSDLFPLRSDLVHLVIAGDGMDAEKLRALVQARCPRPDRVHFLGRFTSPEDIAFAREADLLVDPVDATPTNEAKSSHRVMLALATGTPVIAGDIGIRRFLLPADLQADCLYNPQREDALTEALTRGLDPLFRGRFQRQTTGRLDQWTWETLGKHFVSLVESLPPRAR